MIRKARAGRYAEEHYQRGLRSYRKANRLLFAAICFPFMAAGIVVGVVERDVVAWIAGMVSGGFLSMWIALRDSPPRYVEKWHDGAEGERKTEKVLRPFERSGWYVVHDVQRHYGGAAAKGRSNYDHIAAGRAGVFLLETKNLQGSVDVDNGVPRLTRRHDPERQEAFDGIPRRARAAAARLKQEIEWRTGHAPWVQAVVVFWCEFPEGLIEDGKCVFIHGPRLRAWLESRPNRFSQIEADEIAAGIISIANDEPAAKPATDTREPAPA